MQVRPIQLDKVVYNAGNQSFEALVTIHDGPLTRKYSCAIDAPITMSFEDAAAGLSAQAMRRHTSGRGVYSELKRHTPPARAGRSKFDPKHWLEQIISLPGKHAA